MEGSEVGRVATLVVWVYVVVVAVFFVFFCVWWGWTSEKSETGSGHGCCRVQGGSRVEHKPKKSMSSWKESRKRNADTQWLVTYLPSPSQEPDLKQDSLVYIKELYLPAAPHRHRVASKAIKRQAVSLRAVDEQLLTLSRDYGIYFIPSLCFKSWERPCDFFSLHKQVS